MSTVLSLKQGQMVGSGRFTLIKELGWGGMGVVWLACDERLNEHVALKFLPPEVRADPMAIDDLRAETARSHRLAHPNIVRIHDLHENPGEPAFIAMEFVDGPTLSAQRLQQPDRVMRWDELRPIVQQLCAALEYAHGEGVIHRDLKPANLMLDSRGRLKLADFGIAAVVSDSVSRASGQWTSGTLAYMSPQQLNGDKPRATDDIYALGATLYELLTSKPPFSCGDIPHQVRTLPPKPLDERLADLQLANTIPPDVAAMVMACLAKEATQRPQSARAVAEWIGLELQAKPALRNLIHEVCSETPPAEEPGMVPHVQPVLPAGPAFGRKWIWASAAIGTLLLLALGSWYWRFRVPDQFAQDYFPLAVGATWEYAAETVTRAPGREPQIRSGTEVCRCVAIEKIGGKEYFKVVTFFRDFPDASEATTWYRRAADGIYRIDGKSENPERLFLPLPPRGGYSWTVAESTGKSVSSIPYGLYIHFDISTFGGYAGAKNLGKVPPSSFAPTALDVRGWARTARQAGMTFAVLTAKHEAGFCLWDSQDSDYDIGSSPVKTDILAEFIAACKAEGIVPGLHYSIPDAHNEGKLDFNGPVTPLLFSLIKKQVNELQSRYPEIRILKFDVSARLSRSQCRELCQIVQSRAHRR
jgi:serine/threonine protein kinase